MLFRKVCDDPQNATELIHNCVFVKNGEVYYRDFSREISLIEFARKLNETYSDNIQSVINDDYFSEALHEDLQFAPEDNIDGLIAAFYASLVGMAENREWLKLYETTGLPTTVHPEVLQNCIDTYGADRQVDQAIEEMSELTKALLKYRRKELQYEGISVNPTPDINLEKARKDILEEIADVIIMLTQIIMIYGGRDIVQEVINAKVKRQKQRLEKS